VASDEFIRLSNIPVTLLPVGPDGRVSIVLRPIITNNFVPGRVPLPGKDIKEASINAIHAKLSALDTIAHVFYDLTTSPISTDPCAIEWEC
jgi:GMP synthase (glutamine-hydrolysing)